MTRQAQRLLLIVGVMAVALGAAAVRPASAQSATPARLLDVPYLPQSEDLCGGAAAAMVMRYWGARDLYADAFAPLVDHSAGGIRTDALVAALRTRGWTPLAERGDAVRVQQQLGRGRPVIALIEDRPGRFHYVVVVSWVAGRVIVQDPARAPLRNLAEDAFLRAWDKAERWTLVLLPPGGTPLAPPPDAGDRLAAPAPPSSCAALMDEGIAAANTGDRAGAEQRLRAAARACPRSSAPVRELAGLHAIETNWTAAAEEASRAVALDAGDLYAWNLLATARFVLHDDEGALDAWNRTGQPRVDLVNVQGLGRTRYRVASDAVGLAPRDVLTRESLLLAARRARDVPAFAAARVSYRPEADGRAQIDVAVAEREFVPRGYTRLIGAGIEAATDRSLTGTIASATGGGELLTASWRWWQHRPGVWVTFAAPAPSRIGGVWRVEGTRETQAFGRAAVEQTRSHAGLEYGKWIAARVRIEGGAGVDGWSHADRTGVVNASAQLWPVLERLTLDVGATAWPRAAAGFGRVDAGARWRSTTATQGTVWFARASGQFVSDAAPPFVWPGADTGHARDVLLRAHPLLDDGVIRGGVFGRQLLAGGAEWRRWSRPSRLLMQAAPAVFVDVARATRGFEGTDERVHVDAGLGLRLSLAGMGVLRIDAAHGLRDGRNVISIAIER